MKNKTKIEKMHLENISPGEHAPFSRKEFSERLNRVRAEMAEKEIDLLFLSSPESMYYLSGYQAEWYQTQSPKEWLPNSGVAVEVNHDKFMLFDQEFEEGLIRLTAVSTDTRLFPSSGEPRLRSHGYIVDELKKDGWIPGTVGLEFWSYRPNRAVSEMFQTELEKAGCKVVDGTDIVRDVRAVKSPAEIACIEKAAEIADIGMNAAIENMKPGMTELEVYGEIIYAMTKAGGENPAIPVLVRSHGGGHTLASRRKIRKGDIVAIDVCGVYNKYHSNIFRTFSIGSPHPEIAKVVELSANAFNVLSKIIKPNLLVSEMNQKMNAYYDEVKFGEYLRWCGGYELGIGFPPDWVGWFVYDETIESGDRRFVPGTVVNHESLFYLPRGAITSGIINTIVFEKEEARILGKIPNDLIII